MMQCSIMSVILAHHTHDQIVLASRAVACAFELVVLLWSR